MQNDKQQGFILYGILLWMLGISSLMLHVEQKIISLTHHVQVLNQRRYLRQMLELQCQQWLHTAVSYHTVITTLATWPHKTAEYHTANNQFALSMRLQAWQHYQTRLPDAVHQVLYIEAQIKQNAPLIQLCLQAYYEYQVDTNTTTKHDTTTTLLLLSKREVMCTT